jgi:cytochrome c5
MKVLLPVLAAATLSLSAGLSRAADGKEVYNQACAMCHVPGLANAPKFGDKAAWEPRIKTGRDAMMTAVLKGKGAMPAKGGNPKLTDEQIGAALDFMLAAAK